MHKRLFSATTVFLILLLISGCGFQPVSGSGNVINENRQVSDFNRVSLAGIGNLYLSQGQSISVRIEAEDNLIPYFDISVSGNTLKIGIKNQSIGVSLHPTRSINFYVTSPDLVAFSLSGSGNIFTSEINSDDFEVSLLGSGNIICDGISASDADLYLNGSGDIKVTSLSASLVTAAVSGSGDIQIDRLTADKVQSKTSGLGNIRLAGQVTQQSAEIVGSGDYSAMELKSKQASLHVSGSGNSRVWASDTLDVTILGSGDVIYSGNPKLNVSLSGSGILERTQPQ